MKTLIMAAVAASSLAAALPAAAQYSLDDRGSRIEQRIDRGVQDGSLSWREARSLRGQLISVERLEDRYRANGMTGWESRDIERRYDAISAQLRSQRNDTQYRYDRYDRGRNWYGY